MRITEFHIRRYGPLRYADPLILDRFTLLSGNNEDGKTLTIDALVKLLLGRQVKDFKNIHRVDEYPEGYFVIEDESGRERKLPESGDISQAIGLAPAEWANIFIIRNSDLSIPKEGDFYSSVTDRLTGLRIDEMERIIQELQEGAKLTPGGTFRDLKGEKLKSRLDAAQAILKRTGRLREVQDAEGYDDLLEALAAEKERLLLTKQGIEELEGARLREKLEKGREALSACEEAGLKVFALSGYSEEEKDLWGEQEREIRRLEGERDDVAEKLGEHEAKLEELVRTLAAEEDGYGALKDRKREIDEEVKPLLKNYEESSSKAERERERKAFLNIFWVFFIVATVLSLGGLLFAPAPMTIVALVLMSAGFALTSVFKLVYVARLGALTDLFRTIHTQLSRFGLGGNTFEDVLFKLQEFDESLNSRSAALDDLRTRTKIQESAVDGMKRTQIPEILKKIEEARGRIDDVRRRSGVQTLREYTDRVLEKRGAASLLREQEKVLGSLFGNGGLKAGDELRAFWEDELEDLESHEDAARGIRYSEKRLADLREEEGAGAERIRQIEEKIGDLQNELLAVERDANEVLQLEGDYLNCRTSNDLRVIEEKLEGFILENERKKTCAQESIEIFREIETEEKAKVSELFGGESPVSRHFSEITGGKYTEVRFNQGKMEIEVFRTDGKVFEAATLSAGAYDQLYLSIRLALGEKLLKENKGFFIFDDPFIKSDAGRLRKQLELLVEISRKGWQVLYFSAKREVQEALKRHIDRGTVRHLELPELPGLPV